MGALAGDEWFDSARSLLRKFISTQNGLRDLECCAHALMPFLMIKHSLVITDVLLNIVWGRVIAGFDGYR